MVRRLTRKILESDGYVVLEASGPGEAVRIAEQADQGGQKVDLLLTDMVMPQMTGRELARRLAAERPAMKVLYMSGYTEDAITRDGVLEPGVAFLSKPFLPDDLLRKVRETLDGVR
jgi:CheY-like chemotaxis protein